METLTQMLVVLYIFLASFNILFLFMLLMRRIAEEIKKKKKK